MNTKKKQVREQKHVTKLTAPKNGIELDRSVGWGLSCFHDGKKIGQIEFSVGSIKITKQASQKMLGTLEMSWKDFFDKLEFPDK